MIARQVNNYPGPDTSDMFKPKINILCEAVTLIQATSSCVFVMEDFEIVKCIRMCPLQYNNMQTLVTRDLCHYTVCKSSFKNKGH